MKRKQNIDIEKNETDFQIAYNNQDWDTMWFCIKEACENIAKRVYMSRGVYVSDEKLQDVITDATAYCMEFIHKGVHPQKLSSYCYWRVVRYINKRDPSETELSYEGLCEEYGDGLEEWLNKNLIQITDAHEK